MKPHIRFVSGWWRCGFKDQEMSLYWSWGENPTIALNRWVGSFGQEYI